MKNQIKYKKMSFKYVKNNQKRGLKVTQIEL